jgi:hypothetical protein
MRPRTLFGALALAVGLLSAGSEARAQVSVITLTVDENGNGTINGFTGLQPLPSSMQADPGPGGLASALTYDLLGPPGLVAGDLVLLEPGAGGTLSDLIRFNPQQGSGSMVFYSDSLDGGNDKADTGLPTGRYTNVVTVTELGPEGLNGFVYTPTAGQPGFVAGAPVPVTYVINSDVAPEPSSLALCGTAALTGALISMARRRRRRTAV